jgi:hypothetical protein
VASKTGVGQGYPVSVKVTAINIGSYTETFSVGIFANEALITSQQTTLESGVATTLVFAWNTAGFTKGNYSLSAIANAVPEETNTTDNVFKGGWLVVANVGDVTGPAGYPDKKCDVRDISIVAKLFGVSYPDVRYVPNTDVDNDLKIDIRDVSIVARHFGEVYT